MFKQRGSMNGLKVLIGLLLLLLIVPAAAPAAQDNNEIHMLPSTETVKGPAFYGGNLVIIDGTVDGSLFVAAQDIRINGVVKGNLYTASQNLIVTGAVEGNLHAAAQNIEITGKAQGDALLAGEKATLGKDSVIGRDVLVAASNLTHTGQIQRQLFGAAETITINGVVNDDVKLQVGQLVLKDTAAINGSLKYTSPNQATLAPGARVSGQTDWTMKAPPEKKERTWHDQIVPFLLSLAGALLFWLVTTLWRPEWWESTSAPALKRTLAAVGAGAGTLVFVPIMAVILMITVIGIPLGIVLVLAYGVALYISKIVVAVAVGNWLAARFGWPHTHKGLWLVLLGLSLEALLTSLPIVGIFFKVLVVIVGLGSIVLAYWHPKKAEPSW